MHCERLVELDWVVCELMGHMTHAVAKVACGIGEYELIGQSTTRPAVHDLPSGQSNSTVTVVLATL